MLAKMPTLHENINSLDIQDELSTPKWISLFIEIKYDIIKMAIQSPTQ